MKKGGLLLVVCVSLYVRSAPTDSEMVWLKDVTTSFQTDKRTIGDPNLPDDLTFHLSRRSEALILNLRKNHEIDTNAAIYVVRKLKGGRSLLKKTLNLEKEDVAYYQDRENGAFMTVRCVKRSSGQCDRVINGNIRIEERNYHLRPAETDITSRNLLDVPDLRGTRYVLHDQANVQREISVKHKDAAKVKEENVEQKLKNLLRRFSHGQNNQKHFPFSNFTLSPRNVAGLDNRGKLKQVYYVEITVLTDAGVWNLFSNLMQTDNAPIETGKVENKIREYFSHIINGVNRLYKGIEDTSIEISVTLREFHIFRGTHEFPHMRSMVQTVDGKDSIDAYDYLLDLALWVNRFSSSSDHVMLFTRYHMYDNKTGLNDIGDFEAMDINVECVHNETNMSLILINNPMSGYSFVKGVCEDHYKHSVIQSRDYYFTVATAAHELGHNLGANHDGEGNAKDCKAEDLFLLSSEEPEFVKGAPYSKNHWIFSNCSVEVFKDILKTKTCLKKIGAFCNKQEWMTFVAKLPGEVYSLNEQCEFINGRNSVFCGGKEITQGSDKETKYVDKIVVVIIQTMWPRIGKMPSRKLLCLQIFVSSWNVRIRKRAYANRVFPLQLEEQDVEKICGARKECVFQKLRSHGDFQPYLHEYLCTMETTLD